MFQKDLEQTSFQCIHFCWADEEIPAEDLKAKSFGVFEISAGTAGGKEEFLSLVAEELEFPDFFGENWDALEECLMDLTWLPARGYLLVVNDALAFWQKHPDLAGRFTECWLRAAEEWAQQQIPFHLVFILQVPSMHQRSTGGVEPGW